eukprot:jgi/Tetstr1/460409/TSEL_000086.t1
MIDFACVSSTTPTWGNDSRWCTSGTAATEAERNKLAADRASSAPVQDVHWYYPFVVEDRGRLGKSALTAVYIFAVLLAVRNFPGGPSAPRLHASFVTAKSDAFARAHSSSGAASTSQLLQWMFPVAYSGGFLIAFCS